MKCKKCGIEMKYNIEGSSQVTKCPNCGCTWVTSYIDPIRKDETIYSVIIKQGCNIDVKSIMKLKCYVNLTNPEIIDILKKGNFVLIKQKAVEIKETIAELDKLNIKYKIEPEYKW